MEAIILAGGRGTRLKSVLPNMPKPMAPIAGKPFLRYLLENLYKQNIKRVIFAVGYKYEIIKNYFGDNYKGIQIIYSIENEPLGTGGCIKKALEYVLGHNVFILNGDTYLEIDLNKFKKRHEDLDSDLTLTVKTMINFERYGTVISKKNRVIGFGEKVFKEKGNINCGVYIARADLFNKINVCRRFSFEKDFMEKYADKLNFNIFMTEGYFIDIGIPEDYMKAQSDLFL